MVYNFIFLVRSDRNQDSLALAAEQVGILFEIAVRFNVKSQPLLQRTFRHCNKRPF